MNDAPLGRLSLVARLRRLLQAGEAADLIVGGSTDLCPRDEPTVVAPVPRACGITHRGAVRDRNEDAVHVSGDGRLLVVADGMGGHRAGEVASALAVAAVVEYLTTERREAIETDEAAASALLECFSAAHERVSAAAGARREYRGMGTTLVVACVVRDRVHVCHVGDVRAYLHGVRGLVQLTQDHSLVSTLVRRGEVTPEAAREHPRRHEILQAVGINRSIAPDVSSHALSAGESLLLCSDGLWEMVPDEEIARVLAQAEPLARRGVRLVERANAAGGHDNVTVALYEHADEGPEFR